MGGALCSLSVEAPAGGTAAAALAMYAQVLSASSLESASHRLVGALASQCGFSRVSLGLREGGTIRLLATSGLDLTSLQSDLSQLILGAMEEACEQGRTLSWPVSAGAPDHDLDSICLEQHALQRHVGGSVATLPIGQDGEVFCALCVERHGDPPVRAGELADLAQRMLLAAPALRWMQYGAQPWHQRARRDLAAGWDTLRQPQRRTQRRLLAAAGLGLLFVAAAPLQHEVGGRARVEGAQQQVMSAPTDGFVKTAHVRPGDRVKAGDPLVDLLEEDQRLERERLGSQLVQHENAYAAAMAKSDRVGASTSMARMGEAQAQLALIDGQLARGRVTAPFDALVVQGDLSQSIGAPVRQGDPMMTLATTAQSRVVVDIDEADIGWVRQGQRGYLALSSLPWDSQDVVVERIAPLARAVEGRNVFEVEARLAPPGGELRPGMLGRAQVVVGRMPPLWSWTRHALDRIRLAWWSWLG